MNSYSSQIKDKEITVIKNYVTKNDIVLDVGACVGEFTQLLAEHANHVYAFEPSPYNFKELRINTKHLDNVTLYQVAASNKICETTLYLCPTDKGMNRLYASEWCKGGKTITVATTNIDHYISSNNKFIEAGKRKQVKFIKMDIEGFEYYALQGMRSLLQKDKPVIMMEFHPPSIEESGCRPVDIYNYLKEEMGYNDPINCYTYDPRNPLFDKSKDENSNFRVIKSYEELDRVSRYCPALNILWVHPKSASASAVTAYSKNE